MQSQTASTSDDEREIVLPLAAEEASVAKRVVESGRLQVARITREREQLIDETLERETAEIARIPVGRYVDAMPAVREEGEVIVIPIVEEVLVVERRLFLKEEVCIRRVRTIEKHQESVTLRYQEAVVTRIPVEAPNAEEDPEGGARVQRSSEE